MPENFPSPPTPLPRKRGEARSLVHQPQTFWRLSPQAGQGEMVLGQVLGEYPPDARRFDSFGGHP